MKLRGGAIRRTGQNIKKKKTKSDDSLPLLLLASAGAAPHCPSAGPGAASVRHSKRSKKNFSSMLACLCSSFVVVAAVALLAALITVIWIYIELEKTIGSVTTANIDHPTMVHLTSLAGKGGPFDNNQDSSIMEIPILIPSFDSPGRSSQFPVAPPLGTKEEKDALHADFGNLEIFFLEEDGVARVIYHDEWEDAGHARDFSTKDDDVDQYYAFDDDFIRSSYTTYEDTALKYESRCRRASWHRLQFPTCNVFHEMDTSTNVPRYLRSGAYREVLLHDHTFLGGKETVVWKQIIFGEDFSFTYDMYEFVRMDALVSERLTFSNRIVDVYGLCGQSILAEYLPNGDLDAVTVPTGGYVRPEQLHDKESVRPQNNLCAADKIFVALEMAEAIAVLHGFPDGIIVHDDIQVSQFLYTPDGYIKLNDFNRAEVMLYDEEKQEYCRYHNGRGNGNYRSPEEYLDKPLNEKIDVYSLGNNMYALLTGLWPFYELEDRDEDDAEAKKRLKNGETPFIDPRYRTRSPWEGFLVDLIERCWTFNPDDRPSIFDVVLALRGAAKRIIEEARTKRKAINNNNNNTKK